MASSNLKDIAAVFGKLGFLGFGGPIAAIALMEEELSRKRKWVTNSEFAEMYAVCKLLPGPVSTQMAIYLGYKRSGTIGGILSGCAFISPAFLFVLILSWIYVRSSVVSQASGLFDGMQSAALAVILLSVLQLSKPYVASSKAWTLAILCGILTWYFPSWEPLYILAAGVFGGFWIRHQELLAARSSDTKLRSFFFTPFLFSGVVTQSAQAMPIVESVLSKLFWVCFKAGAFVFGSGLAIVPLLENDAVWRQGWVTQSEFMDGLAIGQITPGPVVITATFIGFKAAGVMGAVVATIAIFLPGFINVLLIVPRAWEKISGTPWARGFASFAIPAVIGAILAASVRLGTAVLTDVPKWIFFLSTIAFVQLLKVPAWAALPLVGGIGFAWGTL